MNHPKKLLTIALILLLSSLPAAAKCTGKNLLTTLPAEASAALDAAVAAQPYATGNFWQARKGDAQIYIAGTYHMADPRHKPALARLKPLLSQVQRLLVEAGPEEETALKAAMADDPDMMLITSGPSLMEQFPAEEWQTLAAAMQARGIAPFIAAKFDPWYVSLLLGVPPCAMGEVANANGLDHLLIASASKQGVPVQALEPYDTLLQLFADLSASEQLDMIRSALQIEGEAADYAVTLSDSYFAGDSRRAWEFMRLQSQQMPGYTASRADAEYARMEDLLLARRNHAWIPVINAAGAKGPALVAFGALHLSGKSGVLNLLAQDGWTVTSLAP